MLETAKLTRPLEVFLKINTGMNRLGVRPAEMAALVERLTHCDAVATIRLMTHLARAEEKRTACRISSRHSTRRARACRIRDRWPIRRESYATRVGGESCAPASCSTAPRRSRTDRPRIGVQPVMTLRSEIIAVQDMRAGECVGYGRRTRRHARRIELGVVACGYADGYPRHAPNGTPVLVCGKRRPPAGRVSMDMLTVDLTHVPEARSAVRSCCGAKACRSMRWPAWRAR